jgi:hypothetical protein
MYIYIYIYILSSNTSIGGSSINETDVATKNFEVSITTRKYQNTFSHKSCQIIVMNISTGLSKVKEISRTLPFDGSK